MNATRKEGHPHGQDQDQAQDRHRLLTARAHGTRATYLAGCRCLPCRAANATYRPAAPRVDAAPVRAHVLALASRGLGSVLVARVAGVSERLVRYVRAGRVPTLRQDIATLILAVEPHDHAKTLPAGPTWVLVDRIMLEGFTRADIARMLGMADTRLRWGRSRRVRPATEARLRALLAKVTADGPM